MKRKITCAVAFLALALILFEFGATLITGGRDMGRGFFKTYTEYLPENPTLLDNLNARIQKLEHAIDLNIFGRTTLLGIGVWLQRLMGKDVINAKWYTTAVLNNGMYYDMYTDPVDMEYTDTLLENISNIDVPMVFMFCRNVIAGSDYMPKGTQALDTSSEFAHLLEERITNAGLPYLDTLAAYERAGLTIEQAQHFSDLHWTHRMALEAAYDLAAYLKDSISPDIDVKRLDISCFTEEEISVPFAGSFATRLGTFNVKFDSIKILYPTYPTSIIYEELDNAAAYKEGSFKEAIIKEERLEADEGKSYSAYSYYCYADYLAQTHTQNPDAADLRVLIFKDSFSTPVSCMLGLVASEVYAVDMRNASDMSYEDWVNYVKPDVVVIALSQPSLRDTGYVIEQAGE